MPGEVLDLAPGAILVTRVSRDEQWPVSTVGQTTDGELLTVRGVSELVEGTTAQDLVRTTVVADTSSHYVRSRLWLEFTLWKTSLPISDDRLVMTPQALATPLSSQREAVAKALQPDQLRTRLLIADMVGLGKTLEIGMILSELICRARRIPIVTSSCGSPGIWYRTCDLRWDPTRDPGGEAA